MKDDLFSKYDFRLKKEFSEPAEDNGRGNGRTVSSDYIEFKRENLPRRLSLYEKSCLFCERILKINPGRKDEERLRMYLEMCHLDISPSAVVSFSVLAPLAFAVLGIVFTVLASFMLKASIPLFFILFFIIIGLFFVFSFQKLPEILANNWRLKASNQMVQCIFYIVTFMRHTSNLELAIKFSSDHLTPPLSIDMKKVLWDVETGKFSTVKESLDHYLESWREWNIEFIEAFHLIEGSLYEPSEDRRLNMIDKALDVMLQETYERMLHYSHELKGPVTMLYMLGIVLPILGLVILPLVASFMTGEKTNPMSIALYVSALYNVALPLTIYYLARMVLSKRPTGYGDTDISEFNPDVKRMRNLIIKLGGRQLVLNPLFISILVSGVLLFVGLLPLAAGLVIPQQTLLSEKSVSEILNIPGFEWVYLLDYKDTGGGIVGPYGIVSSILSLLIPLGIGLGVGLYFSISSENVIKIRDETKKLEDEFASALFQLGNRLGDGVPVEVAVGKVAEGMSNTRGGRFFSIVDSNIRRLGMSVQEAIFNRKTGALLFFPSSLIESSMKVLVESAKKGPLVASRALINVSEYIKDIHRVNERLRDLMADLISDMKQQVSILAPAIAGIVVGITSMIVTILGRLTQQLSVFGAGETAEGIPVGMLDLFGNGIPTYYFQIIVGVYIVQITYILTIMTNGIENGSDSLSEKYNIGRNMIRATLLYTIISFIVILSFNAVASTILGAFVT